MHSLKEWIDTWLRIYAKPNCTIGTYTCYADAERRLFHSFPAWKEIKIDQFTNLMIQEAFNLMGEFYAKSTLNHIRVILHGAFRSAYLNHIKTSLLIKKWRGENPCLQGFSPFLCPFFSSGSAFEAVPVYSFTPCLYTKYPDLHPMHPRR